MKSLILLFVCFSSFLYSQANISYLEYYIDTDPGRGAATSVSFTAGLDIELDFIADLSSVSEGIHTLYIRALADTLWSLAYTRTFIKTNSIIAETANLNYLEYFIDTDPGRGTADSIGFVPSNDISLSFSADLTSTSEGVHTLYIRSRDANNKWSIAFNRAFIRLKAASINTNIDYLEYFIDSDPGRGAATSLTFSAAESVEVYENLDLSTVGDGLHTLYVRTRDTNTNWGISFKRTFIKLSSSSLSPANLNYAEYFIDSDPGRGLGISFPIVASTYVELAHQIDLSAVSEGMHTLYIRTRDESNNWSITSSKPFIKNNGVGSSQITAIEYVLIKDSTYSDTTTVSNFTSADSITTEFTVPLNNFEYSNYTLQLSAVNNQGKKSLPYLQQIQKIRSDTPTVVQPFPDLVLDEDFGTHDFSLGDVFDDDINSPETLLYAVSGENLVTVGFEGFNVRLYSKLDVFGLDTLYFSATDADGSFAVDTVILTINDINDPPAKPQNFSAAAGDDVVNLSWTANSEADLLRYRIYRATSTNLPTVPFDSLSNSETSYSDQNVTNGTSYYYWLSAVDSAGLESPKSDMQNATPLLLSLQTELSIFQSPVLQSHLKFVLTADNPLINMPSISLLQNSISSALSVSQIGNDMRQFKANHSLESAGAFSVTTQSNSENNTVSNRTRNYSASFIETEIATHLSTPQAQLQMNIPAHSFESKQMILTEYNRLDQIVHLSPELRSKKIIRLELAFKSSDFLAKDKLFVYQKENDEWHRIDQSQVFAKQNTVVAPITKLGQFKVMYDPNFSGSNIVPEQFSLMQNFPNPFNPSTKIRYDLAVDSRVKIVIYNVLGQKVQQLIDQFQLAKANYELVWNGKNAQGEQVSSGVYYYQLITKSFVQTKKMILIK